MENETKPVADLSGAILSGADLRGADLEGADIDGADFACADLTGAKLDDGAYWTLRTRSTHAQPTAQAGAGEKND